MVIVKLWCPRIRCSARILPPAIMKWLAKVCRRTWVIWPSGSSICARSIPSRKAALMDSDERQQLFDVLVDFYKNTFRPMADEQWVTWLLTMDGVVIRNFCAGDQQSIHEAEQKHAVKVLAITHALMGRPCAQAERATINELLKMGFAAQERAEAAALREAQGLCWVKDASGLGWLVRAAA